MTEKKLNIQFAPGCFDHFEGTQEELDEMIAEIQGIFEKLTPEELEAQSRPVCIDDLLDDDDISDDEFEQMLSALVGNNDRTLQ
jgi:hypothetical protein